jgi:beta-lactamase regulating signal transducer with metallopeptidase domain
MSMAMFASWILTYLIHSTILILAVWLLVRGIKPIAARVSPSAENLAWKLALVGAFVTASAQLAVGVRPALGALELETAAPVVTREASPASLPMSDRATSSPGFAPVAGRPVAIDEAASTAASAGATEPAPLWPKLLLGAWALGAALMSLRLLLAARTLRRRLRERGPVLEDPVLEGFLTLCRDAEIRRTVVLSQSTRIVSPIALWRREIVVPERAVTELSPAAMRSVLAHELAHLERRDPFWLAGAAIVEALMFLQPLNRIARQGMQESAELLCDDWAIARTGDGVGFAKSLAEVASWEQANRSTLLLAGMVSSERPIVRRVRRALDGDPGRFESDTNPRPTRMLVGLGSLAALIMVAPGAVAASPPGIAPDSGERAASSADSGTWAQREAKARAEQAKRAAEAAELEARRLAAEAEAAAKLAERGTTSTGPHLILRDGDEYLRIDGNGVTLRSKDADIDIIDDGQNPKLRMRMRDGSSELDLDVDLDTITNMALGLLGEELFGGEDLFGGGSSATSGFGGGFGGLGGLGGLGGFDEQAIEREIQALQRELEQELQRELGRGLGSLFGGSPPPQPSQPPQPSTSMPSVAPQPPPEPGALTLI